jgi:hypothetical protein
MRREIVKANWNSATADWHWQITEPVQPERNAVLARAQPSSLTDLDVQLVHATGAAQALMSSARMYAGPVDVPEATASRPFGMRHGSASSQTGSDSATHEGHGHYARTEPRYLSRRTLALACSYMEDNLGENLRSCQ